MKMTKKFSSLFLSILLVITSVFIPSIITASAEADPTQSIIYGITPFETNIVNSKANNYGWSEVYDGSTRTTLAYLTDGDTSKRIDHRSAEGVYLIWEFPESYTVTDVAMWNRGDKDYNSSFDVYIVNELNSSQLTAENKVYSYTADGTDATKYLEATGLSKVGKYAVLHITKAAYNGNTTTRLFEFGVFGTKTGQTCTCDYHENRAFGHASVASRHENSLVKELTPTVSGGANLDRLNNGVVNEYANNDNYGAFLYATNGATITYDLGKVYDITSLSVNIGRFYGYKTNYSVYVGDDASTLYSGTPVYTYSYDSTNALDVGVGQEIKFINNIPAGKFIGFKVGTDDHPYGEAYISEIQVFGKVSTGTVTARAATTADATTDSLIYGKNWAFAFFDNNTVGTEWSYGNTATTYVWLQNGARLTDGTVSTAHADIQNGQRAKLVWALDKTSDITSFLFYNRENSVNASAYDVYASQTLSGLFDDANRIYSYTYKDADGAVITEKAQQKGGQYVTFTGDKIKTANFVAVWIHDSYAENYAGDNGTRVSEIAFFGTEAQNATAGDTFYSAVRTDESNYEAIAAALDSNFVSGKNILSNATLSVRDSEGNPQTLSGRTDPARLTDGTTVTSNSESLEFYGSDWAGNEFIYELAGDAKIKGFAHVKSNYNFTEAYKVYVGSSKETLFSEENLVLDMSDYKTATRVMTTAVKFAEEKAGKYIGIKYTEVVGTQANTSLRLAEIAAFGQLSEGSTEVREATQDDASDQSLIYGKEWSFGVHDANTKDSEWVYNKTSHENVRTSASKTENSIFTNGSASLTDGVASTHIDMYDISETGIGVGAKLVWTLDKTSDITGFMIYNHKSYVNTVAYDVYASETLTGLFDASNIIYSYDFKDSSGNVIESEAAKKGQYVTLSGNKVKRANYVAVWIHDTYSVVGGALNGGTRISEIGFFGTESQNAKTNDKIVSVAYESNLTWETLSTYLGNTDYIAANNVLKSNKLTVKNASGTEVSVPSSAAQMVDGTLTGNNELYGSYLNYEFIYDLGSNTRLEALAHVKGNTNFTEGYKIYASSNLSDLFTDANVVLDMSNTTVAARAMATAVKLNEVKECRYLGVKYLSVDGTSTGTSIRIGEIAAWGEQDDPIIDTADYTLTEADAETMHEDNLLAGLEATWAGGGSNNGGNNPWAAGITDGNAGNYTYEKDGAQKSQKHYDIYAKNDTVELIYALEYEHKITEVAMWQPHDYKNGFDVYVGNSTNTLFSEDNKVASWSYTSNPDAISIYLKIAEEYQKQGRYVGFKFTDHEHTSASARVSEVYANGEQTSWDNSGINTAVGSGEITKLYDSNLLVGRIPEVTGNTGGTSLITGGGLSDGEKVETSIYGTVDGATFITYDLTYPTTFRKVGVWMSNTTRRVSYEVYVGDSTDSLFSGTPVYTWDAEADTSTAQLYSFNTNAPITARYIGWKITDADSTSDDPADHAAITRLAELYVGGVQDMSTITNETIDSIDDIEADNLLVGFVPTVDDAAADETAAEAVTDGKTTAGSGITVSEGTEIVYNLGRSSNLEEYIISADKTLGQYAVYVANTVDELFRSTNCVYTTVNTADDSKIIKISNAIADRAYVGIRVMDPSYDDSTSNVINEIIVTGQFNAYTVSYPTYSSTAFDLGYGEDNLLDGITPTITYLDGRNIKSGSSKNSKVFTGQDGQSLDWWTDDQVAGRTHTDIYFFDAGHITYELGSKKYDISGFEFYYYKDRPIVEYEVYVANSLSSLYNPENRVISYYNSNNSWAQAIKFADGEHPVGKFLGIKIINTNDVDNSNPRIAEIVALGSEYVSVPTNLASTSALKGYVEKDGKITELDHSKFSTAQKQNFFNENNDTPITIDSQGGTLHFVADLCAPMTIDQFVLENVANSSKYLKSFKVYAADFPDEVWQDEKLVFTYNRAATNGQTVVISKQLKGRYVRIEVVDTGTSNGTFNINNISLIGLDDQALDVTNQLYNVGTANISYYGQSNKTYDYASIFGGFNLQYLYDNTLVNAAGIWGASRGGDGMDEESTNIIFKFNNTKAISSIEISSLIDKVYAIDDISVYLGNSVNAIMDKSAEPVGTYYSDGSGVGSMRRDDGNGISETTVFSFESTEALYLRVRINDSVPWFYHRDSKMLALTEVKAIGVDTANVDIGSAGAYSAEFHDPATGISAYFSTLSITDVYRGVTSMKVTRTDVTKAMNSSLDELGFEANGKAYTLKFYDYLGNEVSDFGGRTVKVTVPYDTSLGMAYLAGYYDGEFTLLNSGFEGDLIAYEFPEVVPNTTFAVALMSDAAPEVEPDGETDTDVKDDTTTDEDNSDVTDTVIGDSSDTDDDEVTDTDGEAQDDDDDTPNRRKKYRKVIISGISTMTIIWIIVACVAAAAILGVVLFIIIRKKKLSKQN